MCLMTNHVHFVAVPQTEMSLARGFGEAHRRYTRMKNFAQKIYGYLF
jgi:putative transposase